VLNVKGAMRTKPELRPDGSASFIRQSVEKCIEMLGPGGKIDMFECARRDPDVPLQETLGTLKEFVDAGKIGGVALSEVSANTIREASKITKIVAVEIELSFWTREPLTNGIVAACAELDIPIHAYSPLGHGFLSNTLRSPSDLPSTGNFDWRTILPRFAAENFDANLRLVDAITIIANRKACTTAQLALAWLVGLSRKQGMPEIIPIPGSSNLERVKENAFASQIKLSDEDMAEIDTVLGHFEVKGDRYPAQGMKMLNG